MKFTRSKKLVFFNNKGGVGKTTLAYNTAVKFTNQGYKTVLVNLDPHQAEATQPGSLDNVEKAEHEFNELLNNMFKYPS